MRGFTSKSTADAPIHCEILMIGEKQTEYPRSKLAVSCFWILEFIFLSIFFKESFRNEESNTYCNMFCAFSPLIGETAGLGDRYFSDPVKDAEEEAQEVVDEFFAQANEIALSGRDIKERKRMLSSYKERRKNEADDGTINGLNNW
jgi:hypothetical protein